MSGATRRFVMRRPDSQELGAVNALMTEEDVVTHLTRRQLTASAWLSEVGEQASATDLLSREDAEDSALRYVAHREEERGLNFPPGFSALRTAAQVRAEEDYRWDGWHRVEPAQPLAELLPDAIAQVGLPYEAADAALSAGKARSARPPLLIAAGIALALLVYLMTQG